MWQRPCGNRGASRKPNPCFWQPATSVNVCSAPPGQPQSQGGDTLYLGNVSAPPAPYASVTPAPVSQPAHSSAGASYTSSPGAVAPRKKSRWGLVLFLFAAVIVAVVSAFGGFALRAHMRGERELPVEIPGVSPEG